MFVKDFNPHLGNKDDVIRSHMGLAQSVARRFRWAANNAAHIDFQDIVSEAYIGLIKAFDKFDGRVPKFATYAVPMMQWEIQQFIQRKGQPVAVPRKLYSLVGHIFRNDLHCAPLSEVVAKLGCSELEGAQALKFLKERRSVSLDQPVMSSKDGAEDDCLHDFVGQTPDLTSAYVGDFMDMLGPDERRYVQMREAGHRTEMPLLQTAVRTKLMAYMGLDESEVNQMSLELTKEKYLELRAQGRSDANIHTEYGMSQSQFYRKKAKWGLIGTGQRTKPAINNAIGNRAAQAPQPAVPITHAVDWKSDKITRLEQEIELLKGMLKFYL